ncbi:MAG: hypothetical protein JSR17_01070 [Proteobacteria bacterium]|nr:hypothetical protein [Pseudomonadota bacterium]
MIKILIPDRTTPNNIFGGFLRWIVETNGTLPLSVFFETNSDIDIKCETPSITRFFAEVIKMNGYIEYSGSAYGDDSDNSDESDFVDFDFNTTLNVPPGNYMVYVKIYSFAILSLLNFN